MKEKLIELAKQLLEAAIGESKQEVIHQENTSVVDGVEVQKSVNQEERRALFVALAPQFENFETEDLHEDWYSEEEVAKAMRSYNKHSMKAGLAHRVELSSELAYVEQSYLAPVEFKLETPNGDVTIRKGTWLQEWAFPEPSNGEDTLWPLVKSGEITGISIQCNAKGYMLDDAE